MANTAWSIFLPPRRLDGRTDPSPRSVWRTAGTCRVNTSPVLCRLLFVHPRRSALGRAPHTQQGDRPPPDLPLAVAAASPSVGKSWCLHDRAGTLSKRSFMSTRCGPHLNQPNGRETLLRTILAWPLVWPPSESLQVSLVLRFWLPVESVEHGRSHQVCRFPKSKQSR